MKKQTVINNVKELVKDLEPEIIKHVTRVLSSGCIDIESYEDNYRLPKILVAAALQSIIADLTPTDTAGKKEIENIRNF